MFGAVLHMWSIVTAAFHVDREPNGLDSRVRQELRLTRQATVCLSCGADERQL
jgi:hypothetical protein